jgi:hypothetical protein
MDCSVQDSGLGVAVGFGVGVGSSMATLVAVVRIAGAVTSASVGVGVGSCVHGTGELLKHPATKKQAIREWRNLYS